MMSPVCAPLIYLMNLGVDGVAEIRNLMLYSTPDLTSGFLSGLRSEQQSYTSPEGCRS
jgi:hypothetical protein